MDISSKKTDIFVLALGALGLIAFVMLHELDERTPLLDLPISKNQVVQIASEYLEKHGFETKPYDHAVYFSHGGIDQISLTRTSTRAQSDQQPSDIQGGHWRVRFFRALQEEEFRVSVTPRGKVAKFVHYISEDAEGANLEKSEALKIAQAFIMEQKDISLGEAPLVTATTKKRESRTDHLFTWELPEDQRITVGLHGNVVDAYSRFLDTGTGSGDTEAPQRDLLTDASGLVDSLLTLIALLVFANAYRQGAIPWRGALTLALIMAVASLLEELNGLPRLTALYPTDSSLYAFWGGWAITTIQTVATSGAETFLFAVAGWAVCREAFPTQRNDWLTTTRYWSSPEAARASLMGYVLACVWLGYVTAFYIVGEEFLDISRPGGHEYSELVGTWLPAMDPLTRSFQAAVSEELMYRYFAIALLLRYLRVPILAFLIPALVWGFAHSHYDVSPFYTRGIELTIGGVMMGYFFVRYGLIAVITAHYVYDAVIIGLPLLHSPTGLFFWTGLATVSVAAIPLILGTMRALNDRYLLWRAPVAGLG